MTHIFALILFTYKTVNSYKKFYGVNHFDSPIGSDDDSSFQLKSG